MSGPHNIVDWTLKFNLDKTGLNQLKKEFEKDDVMRHPLVSKIIEKYEAVEND